MGVGNHKLFLLFVFWVFVTCMYSMVLVLAKYIVCIGGGHKCHSGARNHLAVIFLVVESILFGLFTLCMLGDQMSAIASNQTQIDRLKNTKHTYQTEVNEVCGSARAVRFHHSWLYPLPVHFPEGNIRDRVLGYRLLHSTGGGCGEECENEEFSPLIEGSGTASMSSSHSGANSGSQEGDIELGSMPGGGGNGAGAAGSIGHGSSPSGGHIFRKKHVRLKVLRGLIGFLCLLPSTLSWLSSETCGSRSLQQLRRWG